ncbi:hypothetical protein HG536_0C04790 [Torulaspora globosa]|uniref:Uncharacterized protein n=2 Tax=Torulaspora globosa TaxID=48254 RepID=A0A7G3ZFM4_9SACH|nr:uncharacterized protein HG536_0C04790 [Torulaspora globosa]QLL32310.1 hypothetical protein HG536_0C04790 [Torulaspora globosa]
MCQCRCVLAVRCCAASDKKPQTIIPMQDLQVFLSVFTCLFVFYISAHKSVMNRYKTDVPCLQ